MYFLISWHMRHAVLYVTPISRSTRLAATPFRVVVNRNMT